MAIDVGDSARLEVTFKNLAGVLTDPTTVVLKATSPGGVTTQYTLAAAQVVRDNTGLYHYDITLTEAGTWTYEWIAGGTLVAAEYGELFVRKSSTDVTKVRVQCGDTDASFRFLEDYEIQSIMDWNAGVLALTVANCLEVMSTKFSVIQQKIKTLDLQTDGPAVSKELRERAAQIRLTYETTSGGTSDFEIFDVVPSRINELAEYKC
jgi:hypothetical protein